MSKNQSFFPQIFSKNVCKTRALSRDTEQNKENELEILEILCRENNITATTYEEQQRPNKKRPSGAVTIANTRIENLLSDSEDDMP